MLFSNTLVGFLYANADVSAPVDLLGRFECPPDTVSLDEARRRSNKHAYNGTTAACTSSRYTSSTLPSVCCSSSAPPHPACLRGTHCHHRLHRPVGWGGSVGSVEPPRPSKLVPLALVPPAQLGPACRSWFRFFPLLSASFRFFPLLSASFRFFPLLSASFRFFPLLSAYHELFFANELINYFTCMTLYK